MFSNVSSHVHISQHQIEKLYLHMKRRFNQTYTYKYLCPYLKELMYIAKIYLNYNQFSLAIKESISISIIGAVEAFVEYFWVFLAFSLCLILLTLFMALKPEISLFSLNGKRKWLHFLKDSPNVDIS